MADDAREAMRAYGGRRVQRPTEDPTATWRATVGLDVDAAAFFDAHEEYVPRSVRTARVDAMNGGC